MQEKATIEIVIFTVKFWNFFLILFAFYVIIKVNVHNVLPFIHLLFKLRDLRTGVHRVRIALRYILILGTGASSSKTRKLKYSAYR